MTVQVTAPLTIPGNHCVVHGYHWPKPLRTVKHHIHPKEYGGKDTKDNLVLVCDTGHYTIHDLLEQLLSGKAMTGGTRKERALAAQGHASIVAVDARPAANSGAVTSQRPRLFAVTRDQQWAKQRFTERSVPPQRTRWIHPDRPSTWYVLYGMHRPSVILDPRVDLPDPLAVLLNTARADITKVEA